jgi:pimeloyl-ACP methyl ester carboxylesterase
MAKPPSKNPLKHLQPSDLRGIAQLATEATAGVTRIVEGVHQSVWRTLGAPGGQAPDQTRGLTGLVYKSVHGVTQLVGKGVDTSLAAVQSLLTAGNPERPGSPEREAVIAALNGVLGDRLVSTGNPLATRMSLRHRGQALDSLSMPPTGEVTGKVLLLIHGLCMNDLQWQVPAGQTGSDHGAVLGVALGYTPVYVRYNTGLHASQNGHELAAKLEQLVAHWPVPLDEITVLAHSMGGLVTRSAVQVAREAGLRWPAALKNIVFLGTPHHGAPLERAGNWVDTILGSTQYTAPFTKLTQLRSPGITDLRYGHVVDGDWQGHDRFQRKPDSRVFLPLPEGIACFTLAATTATQRSPLADRLIGDGLVPLHSALGEHDDPLRSLVFPKSSQRIMYRMSHLALLNHPDVTQQVLQWLTPETPAV